MIEMSGVIPRTKNLDTVHQKFFEQIQHKYDTKSRQSNNMLEQTTNKIHGKQELDKAIWLFLLGHMLHRDISCRPTADDILEVASITKKENRKHHN